VGALLLTGRRMVFRLEVSLNKILWPEAVSGRVHPAISTSSKLVCPRRKSKIATGNSRSRGLGDGL